MHQTSARNREFGLVFHSNHGCHYHSYELRNKLKPMDIE